MQRSLLALPDVVESHQPTPEVAALAGSVREVAVRIWGTAETVPSLAIASVPPASSAPVAVRTRFAPSATGQLHIGGAR
jgi:hypothetical protein